MRKIEQKELIFKNPTELTFALNKDTLRQRIIDMVAESINSESRFYDSSIFLIGTDNEGNKVTASFFIEARESSFHSQNYFRLHPRSDELFLVGLANWWKSPIYFKNGEPLMFQSSFIVSFSEVDDNRTSVKVRAHSPRIMYLDPFDLRIVQKRVKSTTIEEYTLISLFAKALGAKSRPVQLRTKTL